MVDLHKGIYISGNGPAVILLHSSLSSSKQWLPLVNSLKEKFTVINVDILGYGAADSVEDANSYSTSLEINRIKQVLKQLNIEDKPYHIVGHSFGGALSLKLALEAPHLVKSLSLYEPVPFHLLEKGSEAESLLNDLFKRVNVDNLFIAVEEFMDYWNDKGFYKNLPERVKKSAAQEMKKVNIDSKVLMAEKYGPSDINKIASPVLMMTGKKSPKLSRALADIIVKNLNNVQLEQVDASHMGVISHADIIQPIIYQFIREHN